MSPKLRKKETKKGSNIYTGEEKRKSEAGVRN